MLVLAHSKENLVMEHFSPILEKSGDILHKKLQRVTLQKTKKAYNFAWCNTNILIFFLMLPIPYTYTSHPKIHFIVVPSKMAIKNLTWPLAWSTTGKRAWHGSNLTFSLRENATKNSKANIPNIPKLVPIIQKILPSFYPRRLLKIWCDNLHGRWEENEADLDLTWLQSSVRWPRFMDYVTSESKNCQKGQLFYHGGLVFEKI